MDKRLWPLAEHIARVEHFGVQLRAIRPLTEAVVDPAGYEFVKRAPNTYTAKGWIKNRLKKKFPYLSGCIVNRYGRHLEDHESVEFARDNPEIIWCEPLELSFTGKDPGKFDLFIPFFQKIKADLKPPAKRFWWDWD